MYINILFSVIIIYILKCDNFQSAQRKSTIGSHIIHYIMKGNIESRSRLMVNKDMQYCHPRRNYFISLYFYSDIIRMNQRCYTSV